MGATRLLFLGQRQRRAGQAAAAAETLARAAERDPDSPHVALHHALALADAGCLDLALEELERAAERWPANPVFLTFRGGLLAENDRFDEAESALAAARRLSPGNRLVEAYQALLRMRRGDAEGALRHLGAVGLTDNPHALAALLTEVEAALFRRFGPDTDGHPHRPDALPPPSPRERRARATRLAADGIARLEQGDPVGAWHSLSLAAEKNPSLPDVYAYLGFACIELGEYEKALDHLSRVGAWSKVLDMVHLHRGVCLYKLGRFAEALAEFDTARTVDELGQYSTWIHFFTGRTLVALGRAREAAGHLRGMIELEGDVAVARFRQARELLGLAIPQRAPSGFEVIEERKVTLVVKPAVAPAIRDRQPAPEGAPPKAGRAPMERILIPDGVALVRHGHRGGVFGRLLGDRYLDGTRFVRELAVADALSRRGVPTPEVLAGVRRGTTLPGVYRAEIITREVADARDLADALRDLPNAPLPKVSHLREGIPETLPLPKVSDLREGIPETPPPEASDHAEGIGVLSKGTLLSSSARLVRLCHDAGLRHPDLNARNILLAPDGRAMILDLDRAELVDDLSFRDRAASLARLYRSLHKLELAPNPVTEKDWEAFCAAYAAGDPRLEGATQAVLERCRRGLAWHQRWWRITGKERR